MTLLIISYVLFTLWSLPSTIKSAKCRYHKMGGFHSLVMLLLMVFVIVSVLLFMSGIGHVAAGWVLVAPPLFGMFVGLVLGVSESVK